MAEGQDAAEGTTQRSGWGCLLAGLFLLGSIALALRWPLVGIPLAVVAALVAWRASKREHAAAVAHDARLRALGPPTGDAWRRLFEVEGLGDLIEEVAPHVRPAARVSTTRVERLEVGRSRVGGTPDLARGMAWPRRDGRPLAFLAQFDLAEVAQVMGETSLPGQGHLWFFFDVEGWPSGSDPRDAGGAAVLFDAQGGALEPAAVPDDLPARHRFPLCAVTLEHYEAIPHEANEPWLQQRLGDEARSEAYSEIAVYLAQGWKSNAHTLLGVAIPIQDVMEAECELATGGKTFRTRPKDPDGIKALEAGARQWKLLLQVESDGNAGMMWGDAGCLYFWIREQDLLARRFDRTWTIFQCH